MTITVLQKGGFSTEKNSLAAEMTKRDRRKKYLFARIHRMV